ncbi:hypothetical protein BP6252_10433 [Coleophoma cylindrospora]|uniref:Vacuolar import and degradation protein 21 n=1 Tax=Coleophoma cylindrospora TaxID=1849047 RepID=A0A3D8QSM4_9HELO|nr:hypothetical protein BP6252_10433 [Coleophoma cylindrospora]
MAATSPTIIRPIPRRPFEQNDKPSMPPSPLLSATSIDDLDRSSTSVSRTHSILNLTSSTLLGIYSPTYNTDRDEPLTPWGTGAETPISSRPTLYRTPSAARIPALSTPTVIFALASRTVLLFCMGIVYGLLVRHLHDDRQLAPFQVEGILKPSYDRKYLVFWGVAGVALGSLLPWVDARWAEAIEESHTPGSARDRRTPSTIENDAESSSGIFGGADWTPVVRSFGAFIGIAFAIRKLPWASTLQASLTLAMVNPVLWYLIDRSTAGLLLSIGVGATGTAVVLLAKPDMMPSPASGSRNMMNGTQLPNDLVMGGQEAGFTQERGTGREYTDWTVSGYTRNTLVRATVIPIRRHGVSCNGPALTWESDSSQAQARFTSGVAPGSQNSLAIISYCSINPTSASVFSKNGCRDRLIMSEVVAADRSRLLRSKRAESSGIVTSRKRKLRELYAVCDNEGPLPTIDLSDPDASPINDNEKQFLDVCDILQDRLFDEARLPPRRQLRSDTLKQQPSSPESKFADSPRKKSQRKDVTKSSKPTSPVATNNELLTTEAQDAKAVEGISCDGDAVQRPSSKGSQVSLPAESAAVFNEIVEESFNNADHQQPLQKISDKTEGALERDRITTGVESRPGSPGVDPRKAVPISAEDAAQLSESLIEGQANHDEHHKAATVHLPPREIQEQRLRDIKAHKASPAQENGRLSICPPSRDIGRTAEPLSSPGSTAHSATTPALHEASTDTSPDNESSRYDVDQVEDGEDEAPETPPELRPTPEEVAQKAEHERIQKAQMEISRAEILRSSPAAIDAQIRQEEQAAAEAAVADEDVRMEDTEDGTVKSDTLTTEAGEVVQDIVKDVKESATAPTSELQPETEPTKQPEVADSEGESPPVDAMEVDSRTVKDSFESHPTPETPAGTEAANEVTESPAHSTKESKEASPLTPAASTPRRTPSVAPPSSSERMTTRVASGAIRHKSVSEILGEIPHPNTGSTSEHSPLTKGNDSESMANSHSLSRSTTPQSSSSRVRSLVDRAKDKERSKLSTVVFAKQPLKRNADAHALVANGRRVPQKEAEDYFLPMWRAKPDSKVVQSVETLLTTSHKTITTSNAYIPIVENQATRVLHRIKYLQEIDKWSLRQPRRSLEPNRPKTHWDVVIQEAKWMRTDFREERKWKMAVSRNLASACAEWIGATEEDRKLLQVKAKLPPRPSDVVNKDVDMTDITSSQAHSTPDLIASIDTDSPMDELDEEPRFSLQDTVAPAAIFGLQDDDVVFGLRRTAGTDKLLEELPLYGAPLEISQIAVPNFEFDPDAAWKRPALSLSKYVEGNMQLKTEGPPRKRSRYDYEDDDDDEDEVVFGELNTTQPHLAPESTEVALFNPENKHIRDRIHAGHQFRPPSEFMMPLQSFFESRTASQWTWQEDDDLKKHVRDYSYNWSLISSMLTSKSMFASGAERRTPWECFERWIHLEGLPADMQKTHYFRAYNTRLEMAQRTLADQAANAPPAQPNAAGQIAPVRRRYTTSIRVERRRNQKHLTLVDAMRKLAKKRETTAQKQQHAAGLAAMRKANEQPQPRAQLHTPQDFSRLKHERELQVQERLARFAAQQEHQRRAQLAAASGARNGQNPQGNQQPALPQQMSRGPMPPNNPNAQPMPNPNQLAVPGQNRARTAMAPNPMAQQVPMQNGLQVPQMHMNSVPQAQMQGMPGRLPNPNPALDINLVTQSARIAEQQRQAVRMQQQGQQQHPGQQSQAHNSPPNMRSVPNGVNNGPPYIPNPNMMPPFNPNTNGMSTPPANGLNVPTPGSAGSPRVAQTGNQQPIKALEQQIRQKFPNATNEQVQAMIRDHLTRSVAQAQMTQSAMNAAAGGNMNGNGGQPRVPSGVENSPQLYAQMLRAQQAAQQANAAAGHANHTQQQQQPQQQQQSNLQPPQGSQTPGQQPPRAGSASSGAGK